MCEYKNNFVLLHRIMENKCESEIYLNKYYKKPLKV